MKYCCVYCCVRMRGVLHAWNERKLYTKLGAKEKTMGFVFNKLLMCMRDCGRLLGSTFFSLGIILRETISDEHWTAHVELISMRD